MEFFLIMFAVGMFLPVIPTVLFFEFYHLLRNTNELKYPFLKGFLVGLTTGGYFAYLLWSPDYSGEVGAFIHSVAPYIVIPSVVGGLFVAWLYSGFKRTIFVRMK